MLGLCRQFMTSMISTIAVFIVGQGIGWTSPVLYNIKKNGDPMDMNNSEMGLMASMIFVGNLLSPIPSAKLMDKFGRKNTLHILSAVPLTSWIISYFAESPSFLYIARTIIGLWMGTVFTVLPTYLAEISQANYRGTFVNTYQLMIWGGIIFSYVVGPQVDYYVFNIILGIFPIIYFLLMFLVPESPYFYTIVGKTEKAEESLAWLRAKKPEDLQKEMADILGAVFVRRRTSIQEFVVINVNRKALLMVLMVALTGKASGSTPLRSYLSIVLPEDGPLSPNNCVIINAIFGFVAVLLSMVLVDRFGRKPLFMVSSVGSGIAVFITGAWYFIDQKTDLPSRDYSWVPFVALDLYNLFFNIGLGPLHITLQCELFPISFRAYASGITTVMVSVVSFISSFLFVVLVNYELIYVNFVIFTIACITAAVFIWFYVIETKGKTLNQIQQELRYGRYESIDY